MRIAFFGTPDFAVPTLEALLGSTHEVVLVVTQPDRPRGRGQRVSAGPVKQLAEARGIPVRQPDKLTRDPWEAEFSAFRIDLGVVAAYGKILPDWLLALPRLGFINVHASLLPHYRGASPVHRAVMNGDTETGVTIMRVVKALDAGAMLATATVPIGSDDRTDMVERRLAGIGGALLVSTVDRLAAGPVDEVPQRDADATYAPRLRKEEGLVDWSRSARAIHDQIRGLHPWPHAFTFGPGGRLILHRSAVGSEGTCHAPPGTVVLAARSDVVSVATGDGVLDLLDLQAEGGSAPPGLPRRTSADAWRPSGGVVIAPARRAAYDALLAHAVKGTDLAAAVSAVRAGLTEPRDQTLLTELVSGTVRMRKAIDHQLAARCTRPLDALDAAVLASLRLGAFQLMYLDRVPASAAVNDAVALTRRGGKTSAGGMVNAVLRALSRDREKLIWPDAPEPVALAVRHSHPEWLVERWLARYGSERTERWLAFNNEAPHLCLATNRLHGTREELAQRLLAEGVATEPTRRARHGLLVVGGPALSTEAFREGRFVVQDEASQLITELGSVTPGQRVLDLCAAPGGKTVALASRCEPGGLVVACDVRPRRVRLLRATLERTGRARVPVVQVPAAGDLPFSAGTFDTVLVDAPCSGLGTLRRDPDIRWGRRAEDLPRLAAAQLTLAHRAAVLVKPGGELIYSTCSSEPDENEAVVAAFLADAPDFRLVHEHRTLPPDDGLEAFYGAVIARNL